MGWIDEVEALPEDVHAFYAGDLRSRLRDQLLAKSQLEHENSTRRDQESPDGIEDIGVLKVIQVAPDVWSLVIPAPHNGAWKRCSAAVRPLSQLAILTRLLFITCERVWLEDFSAMSNTKESMLAFKSKVESVLNATAFPQELSASKRDARRILSATATLSRYGSLARDSSLSAEKRDAIRSVASKTVQKYVLILMFVHASAKC